MASLHKTIIHGTGWAFFLRVLNAGAVLAVNMLLTRILSPEDVGLYFLVLSLVSLLTYLSSFGLHLAVVRLVAEALAKKLSGRARSLVYRVLGLSLANGCLVFLVMVGGGMHLVNELFYKSEGLERSILLASLWVLTWALQMNVAEIFRGLHDIKFAVLFRRLFSSGCFLLFLLFCLYDATGITFDTVLWGTVGSWVTSSAVSLILCFGKTRSLKGEGRSSYGEIIGLAWPLGFTSLFTLGMAQADIWILGAIGPLDNLAVYGVVVRLLRQVLFPLFVITATIQPLIAGLYTEGRKSELQDVLRGATTVATGVGIGVLLWVFFFGEWTLVVLFGEYYATGNMLLLILSVGTLFRMIDCSNQMTLMMTGHERVAMMLSLLYTLSVVFGGILVVPIYGVIGMSVVMAMTSMLRCILHSYFVKRQTGLLTMPCLNPKTAIEIIRLRRGQQKGR